MARSIDWMLTRIRPYSGCSAKTHDLRWTIDGGQTNNFSKMLDKGGRHENSHYQEVQGQARRQQDRYRRRHLIISCEPRAEVGFRPGTTLKRLCARVRWK